MSDFADRLADEKSSGDCKKCFMHALEKVAVKLWYDDFFFE